MNLKKHLRAFFYNLFALWVVAQAFSGVHLAQGLQSYLLAALSLTLVNILVKPIIKLLLLPVNLLTLGAFRWLINVLALYLTTLVYPPFQIGGFFFSGYSRQGFVIPATELGTFWAYVLVSFTLSFITSFLFWLAK